MKISKILLAAATCGMFALTVNATHTWNDYHWATEDGTVYLPAVSQLTSDWLGSYDESLNRWEQSASIDHATRTSGSTSRKNRRRCSAQLGKMVTCNATYGNNGWAGLASINLDNQGHISQGVAKMNDTYLANDTVDYRNHVMCQEIGHVYGLGHTSENGSSQKTCMDYSNDIDSQWPNAHDYQILADIYGHTDGYTTVADSGGSEPPPKPCKGKKCRSGAKDVPTPKVKVKQNGNKSQIWVSPGDDGSIWIHHVTLAEGYDDAHFGDDLH